MANSTTTQASDKDNQMNIIFNAFFECPKTMKEVDNETGIMRESICRYVRALKAQNKIQLISLRKCKITNCDGVGEYSTNPDFFVVSNQLDLFDYGNE